jgi:hypothetical protein
MFFLQNNFNQLQSFSTDLFERERVQEENSGFYIPVSVVDSRRENSANYVDFATFFIAPVVGKKHFEACCYVQSFCEYVTKSDEALALLIYENNFDRWFSMGKANNWTSSSVRPKYTTGGNACQTPKKKSKKSIKEKQGNVDYSQVVLDISTSARYQGWSVSGIKRFNELFDCIEKERASPIGRLFDDALIQFSVKEKEQMRKKQKHEINTFETCRHELWVEDNLAEKNGDLMHFEAAEDLMAGGSHNEDESGIAGFLHGNSFAI